MLIPPTDYVEEGARFTIYEGSGCAPAEEESILEVLIQELWSIVPPLISVMVYYRESSLSLLLRVLY